MVDIYYYPRKWKKGSQLPTMAEKKRCDDTRIVYREEGEGESRKDTWEDAHKSCS